MTIHSELIACIGAMGFAHAPADIFRELLGCPHPGPPPLAQGRELKSPPPVAGGGPGWEQSSAVISDWPAFAASWNDLGLDSYMADGGRYRRRRFGAFAVATHEIVRKPHQPHYQSRDYNPLNGGIERWFEPLTDAIASHAILHACLRVCCSLFDSLTHNPPPVWHTEVHQFRIEARPGEYGLPTPEGLHRDGVDWVLVLLIARENIAEGVTTIYDPNKQPLGSFTLTLPFDAALVDDSRVYHGVTAVQPLDPTRPAYRDVLVATFRRP